MPPLKCFILAFIEEAETIFAQNSHFVHQKKDKFCLIQSQSFLGLPFIVAILASFFISHFEDSMVTCVVQYI